METPQDFGTHCSLGDNQSWVNLVNNLAYVNGVQRESYIQQLWDSDVMPNDLIPAFIHETTHHWCFSSPVGGVLAYIQLRARRKALAITDTDASNTDVESRLLASLVQSLGGSPTNKHLVEQEIEEDLLRYQTAVALFKPLAEGLALFAEFDIVSRGSTARSVVLDRIFEYFLLKPTFETFGDLVTKTPFIQDYAVGQLLFNARTSDAGLERKENLLVQPLSSDNGGYLIGYLTIKRLWRIAAAKSHRMSNETDLLLMFLWSFFYDDYGFVSVLLDPNTRGIESVNAIVKYFQERFWEFDDLNLDTVIAQYEQLVEQGASNEQFWSFMYKNSAVARLGKERAERLTSEEGDPDHESISSLVSLHLDMPTLTRRHLMAFGHWEIVTRIDDQGNVFVLHDDKQIISAKVIGSPDPGERSGSLDVFFSTRTGTMYRLFVVSQGAKIIAIAARGVDKEGMIDDDDIATFAEYIGNRRMITYQYNIGEKILEKVVGAAFIDSTLEMYRDQIKESIDNIYIDVALSRVPEDKFELCRNIMRDAGFYRMVRGDISLVRSLALLSNGCSVMPHRSILEPLFSERGLNLDAALEAFAACTEMYGLPEIIELDGYLFSHV